MQSLHGFSLWLQPSVGLLSIRSSTLQSSVQIGQPWVTSLPPFDHLNSCDSGAGDGVCSSFDNLKFVDRLPG